MTWLRRLLLSREIERSLRSRKVVRKARQEAAERGISTEWKRRAQRAREVFAHERRVG